MHPDTSASTVACICWGESSSRATIARPLTLAAVASSLSTSPRQLQRAYAEFDDCFHEDLLARRMSARPQLLIEQRAVAVSDVGRLVGYRSNSHFARAFRGRYSLSPALFRARALDTPPLGGDTRAHARARRRRLVLASRSSSSAPGSVIRMRAPPPGGALGGDGAAVLADDLSDDRKSQSRARAPACLGAAVEAVEHVGHILGGDPLSVVADGQRRLP